MDREVKLGIACLRTVSKSADTKLYFYQYNREHPCSLLLTIKMFPVSLFLCDAASTTRIKYRCWRPGPTAPSTTLRNILIQVVEGIPSGSGWENLFTAVIRIPHLGEQV